MIKLGGPVEIAKKLVSLNSENPPGTRTQCGQYVFDFLKKLGLKPIKQFIDKEKFNVIVIGKGPLLVQGHLDTVQFGDAKKWKRNPAGEIREGKLFGRGSSDTKGNIACFLAALAENRKNGSGRRRQPSPISMIFTCVEENSFSAIQKAMKLRKTKLRHIKYSITIEPTNGKLISCNKGQYTFEITAQGKTAHASDPTKGINAIEKLVAVVPRIKSYEKQINKRSHKLMGRATLNIGIIKGGSAANIVPDSASMIIDRRVITSEKPQQVIKEMARAVRPLRSRLLRRIDPAETSSKSKIVKIMRGILAFEKMDAKIYGYRATAELSEIRKHGI
ncbi:M20/M25/M40 family metallo-hydrolase, partial [Candidatus Peregrinibacteria bacterium]|nr:M20/M25/M40 family metallo-hydrolase [Candidatus Peregrinibacteria bacterium]